MQHQSCSHGAAIRGEFFERQEYQCALIDHTTSKNTHLKPGSSLFSLSELKGKPKHSMVLRSDCGTSLQPLFLLNGKLLWCCNTSDAFALLLLPTGLSSPSSSWHFLVYTHSQGKKRERKIDRSVACDILAHICQIRSLLQLRRIIFDLIWLILPL